MPRLITIYALNGYEGTVAPADASPRWSIIFRKGVAEVPLALFNSGSFQAYYTRQELLGRWSTQAPVQAEVEIIPPTPELVKKRTSPPKPKSRSATVRPPTAAVKARADRK